MKTKILGWIIFVAGIVSCLQIILNFYNLSLSLGIEDSRTLETLIGIPIYLFFSFVGFSLKNHKKWSWYFALVFSFLGVKNIAFSIFRYLLIIMISARYGESLSINSILAIFFGTLFSIAYMIFTYYALISERSLFFIKKENQTLPPVNQPPQTPLQNPIQPQNELK